MLYTLTLFHLLPHFRLLIFLSLKLLALLVKIVVNGSMFVTIGKVALCPCNPRSKQFLPRLFVYLFHRRRFSQLKFIVINFYLILKAVPDLRGSCRRNPTMMRIQNPFILITSLLFSSHYSKMAISQINAVYSVHFFLH